MSGKKLAIIGLVVVLVLGGSAFVNIHLEDECSRFSGNQFANAGS